MAIGYNPNVVTNGLVLCVDAANNKSYSGSGTAWNDMTLSGNNGTLINGPTFNSGNGGSIVFDGINDYSSFPTGFISSLTSFSVDSWFYWTDNGNWSRIFDFGTGTNVYTYLTPSSDNAKVRFAITVSSFGSEQRLETSKFTSNTWNNVVITLSGTTGRMYVNGSLVQTNTGMTLNFSSLGSTALNYLGRSQWSSDPYLSGRISKFSIYNTALTADQVLQNYNAFRGRFGL